MAKIKVLFIIKVMFFVGMMSVSAYPESEVKPSYVIRTISVDPAKIIITFNRRPGFLNQELKYRNSTVTIPKIKGLFQVALPLKIPNYVSVRRIVGVDKMFFVYWHQFGEESDEVVLLKNWEGSKATFFIKRDSVNISKTGAEDNSRLGNFTVDQHYMISEQD